MNDLSLRHVDVWHGKHKGIGFTIKMFKDSEETERWAYYIQLHENNIPEEYLDKVFLTAKDDPKWYNMYDYTDSLLSRLDWHGGITYYEYVCNVPGHRVVEAGCDYSHIFDEGMYYNEVSISYDARRAIDSLFETIPGLKVRDWRTGEYKQPVKE